MATACHDSVEDCSGPPGYVPLHGLRRHQPLRLSGGTEVCDGADNDCDGETDEGTR